MSQHTPGPWHVAGGVQIRTDRHQIAKVWMMRQGEGQANARLISAAPELLDALESLIAIEDSVDPMGLLHGVASMKARVLIAKIKGEQEKK